MHPNAFRTALLSSAVVFALPSAAVEVTVRNDSLNDFGTAVIVSGFTANERAAAWLTSSCSGSLRAVQVFWRSLAGNASPQFGQRIDIHRAGAFPNPGPVAVSILGPVLSDGVLNEFRYLDENNSVPIVVPVAQNEVFVVALDFDVAPPSVGPSVVRDIDGCQASRNTIYAELAPGSLAWVSACALGVTGDWVIRGIVDCASGTLADLSVTKVADRPAYVAGQALNYTITAANAGPNAVVGATLSDAFPAALVNSSWSCAAAAGGACPTPATGTGNLNALISLPVGGSVTFTATTTVAPGTTQAVVNSATLNAPAGVSDPNLANNIGAATTPALTDPIFAHGFEAP